MIESYQNNYFMNKMIEDDYEESKKNFEDNLIKINHIQPERSKREDFSQTEIKSVKRYGALNIMET